MEDELNTLLQYVESKLPPTVYLQKNKENYQKAIQSANSIYKMIYDIDEDCKIDIYSDELLHTSLCVCITSSLIVIDYIDKFCEAIKVANNFEVNVKEDGLIELGIIYQDVFEFVKPQTK